MNPLPVYEQFPWFLRDQRKLDPVEASPWKRYGIERLRGTSEDGQSFHYFIEVGEPLEMHQSDLGNEFFANELQKVNVERPASVAKFCEKYGFPVSAGYDGIQRLSWFRNRFNCPGTPFRPASEWHELANESVSTVHAYLGHPAEQDADPKLREYEPYLLSEAARQIHLDDREVVGAISEAEVVQTIRALQTATALLPAAAYAMQQNNEWGASKVADYLCERSHMSQHGPTFFLLSDDDPLLRGSRFLSYDKRLMGDAAFRSMVEEGERAGFNTRAAYTASLGEGLVMASNNCLGFLSTSLRVYSMPIDGFSIEFAQEKYEEETNIWQKMVDKLTCRRGGDILSRDTIGSLSAAIISQFGTTYDDPSEWRVCENCGRVFKKYREEKPGRVIQQTRFCKRSCANQFSKKRNLVLNSALSD